MKRNLCVLLLVAVLGGEASAMESEFAAGRAYYVEGEFKKAAAHFQLALRVDPNDADSYYWMGMSYQVLAEIAFPFAGKYNSKARMCLTKAVELAPTRSDYRRELFDFLVASAGSSRAVRRQAADLMRTVPEPDPDYNYMHRRFELERRINASADAQLGRLFLAIPRATYRLAELPASALSGWRAAWLEPLGSDDGMSAPAGKGTAGVGEW